MKLNGLIKTLVVALGAMGATVTFQLPAQAQNAIFFCANSSSTGLPTTYYYNPSRVSNPTPVVRWYSNYFSASGYTPWQRCEEVTGRFQKFHDQGLLDYVTTGYVNGLPVVCASSGQGCKPNNVLFTLKRGEDAALAVQKLFNLGSAVASGGSAAPLYETSADDNSISVNMKQFLTNAPTESGVPVPGASQVPQSPGQPSTGGRSSW
jgi:hypothetical protein